MPEATTPAPTPGPTPGPTLGIVLASADPGRVHAALSMAAAAAAIGRRVVLLAAGPGCRILANGDPFDPAFESRARAAGVAPCLLLRDTLAELGVRLLACDAALRLDPVPALCPGAAVAGMATFLREAGTAPVISF